METVDKIKQLRRNANQIYDLFLNKIPKWKSDTHIYDKTGWGFNGDDRFMACKAVSVFFTSHKGAYGDSGCTTQCDLDYDLFSKHLIQYLNSNKETIMLAIARQIEDEAKALKEKAESELNAEMNKLKELETL